EVEPERGAARREATRLEGREAGAAPDVEHPVARSDDGGVDQMGAGAHRRALVAVGVSGPVLALVAVPRGRGFDVGDAHGSASLTGTGIVPLGVTSIPPKGG